MRRRLAQPTGISELKKQSELVRAVLAEVVGSCFGGDKWETGIQLDDQSYVVRIAFCFGLPVAALAQTIGYITGWHINPAVGLIIGRKIEMTKGALYAVGQCAICETAIFESYVRRDMIGADTLGETALGSKVTTGQAVTMEMVITTLLLLVIFGGQFSGNVKTVKGSAPLVIGLLVTACHQNAVHGMPFTGASTNPAISLGPAILRGNSSNHWVYWAGPLLGASLAALLYEALRRVRRVEKKWADKSKKESRRRKCCEDTGVKDEG